MDSRKNSGMEDSVQGPRKTSTVAWDAASTATATRAPYNTEKVSDILKKVEELKEAEDETKRKRAAQHRSMEFISNRAANKKNSDGSEGLNSSLSNLAETEEASKGQFNIRSPSSMTRICAIQSPLSVSTSPIASGSDLSELPSKLSKSIQDFSQKSPRRTTSGQISTSLDNIDESGKRSENGSLNNLSGIPASVSLASLNLNTRRKSRIPSINTADLPSSPASVASSPTKSSTSVKNFKEWYTQILQLSDSSSLKFTQELQTVPDKIELKYIFGSKTEEIDSIERMMFVAKCYEQMKQHDNWSIKPDLKEPANVPDGMIVRLVDIMPDYGIEGAVYEVQDDNDLDIVAQGNRKDLLDALIFPWDQDMSYAEVFLASYRFFMSPRDVLDCLVGWYNADAEDDVYQGSEAFLRKNRKHIQNRTIKVLLAWIRNHWHDFHDNPEMNQELNFFVDYLVKVSFSNNQKLTQAIREQRLTWYTYQYIPIFPPLRPNQQQDLSKPLIGEWQIEDFAHNLTMIDNIYFRLLKPDIYYQILKSPATIKSGGFNVPFKAIMDFCLWFRTIVGYTATVIAKEENTKKKTNYIKRFLKVAKSCKDLSNYNSLFAIIHGLKRPTVLMWSQSWEGLASKYVELFKELDEIVNQSNGYQAYSQEIQNVDPPAVPFILPYIQDLIEIHSNWPESVKNDAVSPKDQTINFKKHYHMYSIAAELEVFRLGSYHGKLKGDRETNLQLVNHIQSLAMLDDKALGQGMLFSSPTTAQWNETASGSMASRAVKRTTQIYKSAPVSPV